MGSSSEFRRVLMPLLALAGVGVGAVIAIALKRPHKAGKKDKRSPKENSISRLPVDILCHVISYLDLKDAVRTSVLSRRWRYLYCTQPDPKFECHKMLGNKHNSCSEYYNYKSIAAVGEILHLRSGLPMKSFTLQFCEMLKFYSHLRRWLDYVVTSGVRKLDLRFGCGSMLCDTPGWAYLTVFPFQVLSSAYMLEHVQLLGCILEPNFQGPFNSLKELILYWVPLDKGEVETILSSCLQLRLLNLRYCKLPAMLFVDAFELRTLKIFHCENVNGIYFSAPNLDYFAYLGKSPLLFFPSEVPNLRKVCLGLEYHNHRFDGFLQDAPCLDTLWIQATSYQVKCIRTEMPTLYNVCWLSLHVIEGSLDLQDIASLITACPNLSRFDLSTCLSSLSYTERDEDVPLTCVHLKRVVLDGFKFYAAQRKFAAHLMRCAPALEEMCIYTAYCLYPLGREAERNLPFYRRVFPNELISRTRKQLQAQASSSSAIVNFVV